MDNNNIGIISKENKISNSAQKPTLSLILCAILSIFWVIFIWGFWEKDIDALGVNVFVFLLLFTFIFIRILYKEKRYSSGDLVWNIPIFLIILSYLIYDNPFIKAFSLVIFPFLFAFFYNYAMLKGKKAYYWDFQFFFKIFWRIFSFFAKITGSLFLYLELIIPAEKEKKKLISRIIFGLILFLIVAFIFFIPLLSAADPVFAGQIEFIIHWFKDVFSAQIFSKIITVFILAILISSAIFAWTKEFSYQPKEKDKKTVDPIVSGIVLGGILILYLLFLWIQINRLWIGVLPFDFKTTENLVKSGFWQLLFLSIVNIAIYFFAYKRTALLVKRILTAFILASLLLLTSAAYRMGLYVIAYGLSYEKFFASYTVIYCAILFAWLIFSSFINKQYDIAKFVIFLFIWMYGVVAILPVEQFIFRANLNLAGREQSRIKIYELTMLSSDVLGIAKQYKNRGLLKDDYVVPEALKDAENRFSWDYWIKKQEKRIAEKKWYELNLINMFGK